MLKTDYILYICKKVGVQGLSFVPPKGKEQKFSETFVQY